MIIESIRLKGTAHVHQTVLLYIFMVKKILGHMSNRYEAEFFPFFRPFYTWPHTEKVGSKTVTFATETEYVNFLKNDSSSGFLWMDHQGLQTVLSAYQIEIHILKVGGITDARWTHLSPDQRLESFNKKKENNFMVHDMWLLHQDEVHFDLIIKKDSVLANQELFVERSDNSCQKCEFKSQEESELRKHIENMHASNMNDNCE